MASAPSDVVGAYTSWLGGRPVLIEAFHCGWTARKRLYWLTGRAKSLDAPAPADWEWRDSDPLHAGELRYVGGKPLPPRVHFEQGFCPLTQPGAVMKGEAKAMHTFTREFFHPPDRVPQVSPAAAQRFFEGGRRFPASAHEEHSLLWRGSSWRVPSPAERSMMLGVPASATTAVDLEGPRRTQVRNSPLGNGFHIPSIMCILSLLVCLCDAKPRLLQPSPDWELRARLHHTVWEPKFLESFPDLLGPEDVARDMRSQFPRVDSLLQKGPPRDHALILEVTLQEVDKGFCSALMTRQELTICSAAGVGARWSASSSTKPTRAG